jgi:hypothetical protein
MENSLIVAVYESVLFRNSHYGHSFFPYFIREVYRKPPKSVARLERITKGPVFTRMNATLRSGTQDI